MTADYQCNMTGYIRKYGFHCCGKGITQWEAEHVLQLDPVPPAEEGDRYIALAIENRELRYLMFYLHHAEDWLNKKVRGLLSLDGWFRYDPERFLDMKLACVEVILEKFHEFDPAQNVKFTTFIYPFLKDTMRFFQMGEEAWELSSMSVYKRVRRMAAIYHKYDEDATKAISEFCSVTGCTGETAARYLEMACGHRARENYFVTQPNEDGEELFEEVGQDDSWNYSYILWNGMRAEAIQDAFWKLRSRDQALLERRNAVCMTCGRVGPLSECQSYEQLSAIFQASTDKGAEKAYKRAVQKLTDNLIENGVLRSVKICRKEEMKHKKKIATAVYEYQADRDGEWGEIVFDFGNGTAEILRLAEWDTTKTQTYAKKAIAHLRRLPNEKLPKQDEIIFEKQ